MYANECARRHAIFMKLNTGNFEIPSRGIPSGYTLPSAIKEEISNERSFSDKCRNGGARRLIDFACNARFVSRVLSSSFAISGTPAYNAAIQSVDFSFLGNKAVLRDDKMHTFIDSVPRFLIILLVPNYQILCCENYRIIIINFTGVSELKSKVIE